MNKPKVLITHWDVPKVAIDLLSRKCDLVINEEKPYPSREQIIHKAKGVDAIFWAAKTTLDKEVLNAAGSQLRVVGTMSVGLDHIDVEELKARNIKLGNTPKVLNSAVADIAVFLALGASRRAHEGRLSIENSTWHFGIRWLLGTDLMDSTVGIVGLGNIGTDIVKRLIPFNVKQFVYTGHKEKEEGKKLGAKFITFDELLNVSDFVFITAPLTEETKGMFNESAFNKMKNTTVLVNVARGPIVDQPALIKALKNNTIFAAGLDVMTPEPLPSDHELLKLPNCILLPHLGSATVKTRNSMAELTAQNILKGLDGEPMLAPVV